MKRQPARDGLQARRCPGAKLRRVVILMVTTAIPILALGGGATIDLGAAGSRDDILVPLVFSGPSIGLGGFLGWRGLGAEQDASLLAGFAYLTNRFGHEAALITLDARWTALSPALATPAGYVQFGSGLVYEVRDSYLGSWDDAHLYWIGTLGLPLVVQHRTSLGTRWNARSRLSVQFLTLESRPPGYRKNKQDDLDNPAFLLGTPLESPDWKAPWQHLDVAVDVNMRRSESPWEFGIRGAAVRAADPKQAFVLESGILISRNWGGQ